MKKKLRKRPKKKKRAVTIQMGGTESGRFQTAKPNELTTSCFTGEQPLAQDRAEKEGQRVKVSVPDAMSGYVRAAEMMAGRRYRYHKTAGCYYEMPKSANASSLWQRLDRLAQRQSIHSRDVFLMAELQRIGPTKAIVAWRVSEGMGKDGADKREYVVLDPDTLLVQTAAA